MATYGVLHPKSDVDRLYIERKEGGKGLMNVERCVREEENTCCIYAANSEEKLIRRVTVAATIKTENTVTSGEFKKQKTQEFKENWRAKKMHGQFVKEMPEEVDKDKTWQ